MRLPFENFSAIIVTSFLVVIGLTGISRGEDFATPGEFFQGIGRDVYEIDKLADQMAFRYGWELRFNGGCKDSLALYKHMRTHMDLTNDLILAYRGKCGRSFHKAACNVRESLTCIENLRKRARVSESVGRLIARACPIATYVHANSIAFRSGTCLDSNPGSTHRSTELTFNRHSPGSGWWR